MDNQDAVGRWRQVTFWCDDWRAAEQAAVDHLGPRLTVAPCVDAITSWWFVRKGAAWRLRYLPAPRQDRTATTLVDDVMRDLVSRKAICRWASTIYEPEIHAFGGTSGICIAHELAHVDCRHLLDHLRHPDDHRRWPELGFLLACALMRGARLEWYEQGDVWARVAAHRGPAPPHRQGVAAEQVRVLLTAKADQPYSPLAAAPAWRVAFRDAGGRLADLADAGLLTRGLRGVLAHHILFAWNRAGIPAAQQARLATTAAHVIFHDESGHASRPMNRSAEDGATTLNAVTTYATHLDPDQLRAELADYLHGRPAHASAPVEAAFRAVPRHVFLPGVELAEAYAAKAVVTKRAADGTALSSASHPHIVAFMLDQLDVRPGQRALEIGAGTGFNAALLAELVGPAGQVTTIDIDDDIVDAARQALTTAGYPQVEVICRDGAHGHPDPAPFDRIIVTAGAWDLARAWWRQLAPGGRLVVPLVLHDSGLTRSVAFDLQPDGTMISRSAKVCGFVPMRGTTAHPEDGLHLADGVRLNIDSADLPDPAVLGHAFAYTGREVWSGIVIEDHQPVEHLDLWLAITTNKYFGRLSVTAAARESGLVTPARRWAGAALYDGDTLAYLTLRPVTGESDELGVVAYGSQGDSLGDHLLDLLHRWDKQRPAQPLITAHPVGVSDDQLSHGALVDRPGARLTITW